MKLFSLLGVVVMAATSFVAAQSLIGEPDCAIPCLTSAISLSGCLLNDQACACGTAYASIQSAATPCLLKACAQADLLIAASVGISSCSAFSASATASGIIKTMASDCSSGSLSTLTSGSVVSTEVVTTQATTTQTSITIPGGLTSSAITPAPLATTGASVSSGEGSGNVTIETSTSISNPGGLMSSANGTTGISTSTSTLSLTSILSQSSKTTSGGASTTGTGAGGTTTASAPAQASSNVASGMDVNVNVKMVGGLFGLFAGVVFVL